MTPDSSSPQAPVTKSPAPGEGSSPSGSKPATGPLSSVQEARNAPEVRKITAAAASRPPQRGIITAGKRALLTEALDGLELGEGDLFYIEHLAEAEDVEVVLAIAMWIARSRAADRRADRP